MCTASLPHRVLLACLVVFATANGLNLTVCSGTELTIRKLAEFNRKGCDVIEGSLVLAKAICGRHFSRNDTLATKSITSLNSIVEITGSLLVFELEDVVHDLGQILPNLAVVRGNPHYRYVGVNAGVVVARNEYLKGINLTKLTHTLGYTSVLLRKNPQLQYFYTVDWVDISSEGNDAVVLDGAGGDEECPSECDGHCWNANTCQTFLPKNCSATDSTGNCTCHEECLSFCSGTTDQDCTSCRHFHYQGRCVRSCPNGTVIVSGWRCAEQCPDIVDDYAQRGNTSVPTFAFSGTCLMKCPHSYRGDMQTRTCVYCNGNPCPRRCTGGTIRTLREAKRFEGCTHVESSLTISLPTECIADEEERLKDYLGGIEHVDGFLLILHSHMLLSLSFLDNLTSIGANELWQFGDQLYGLAIVGNRNLRTVQWRGQHKLWLGGRIDVLVLVAANYLVCQDSVAELKSLFPCGFHEWDNSILAICKYGQLNVTVSTDNVTTDLHWNPVPKHNQTFLTGYQLFWSRLGVIGSGLHPLPEQYDENNPSHCSNMRWKSMWIDNVTSYRLGDEVLHPWYTTVFQIRAEFARRGISFRSDLELADGYQAVPSCPIIESLDPALFNASIVWSPPEYYGMNVTHYRIVVIELQYQEDSFENSSHTSSHDNELCSRDTAINRITSECLPMTHGIKVMTSDTEVSVGEVCSPNRCIETITGLLNFVQYNVQIQARNPSGCGLPTPQFNFTTESDAELDQVTDLNHTTRRGPSLLTQMVTVVWQRPKYPNGGYVRYYQVDIKFDTLTEQEERSIKADRDRWVSPRMEQLRCVNMSGTQFLYRCRIRSNETRISLNFTLFRLHGRRLNYSLEIIVASALGDPSNTTKGKKMQFDLDVAPSTREDDKPRRVIIAVSVGVVLALLVVGVVLLSCYVWRLRRHKKQLRDRLEKTFNLYEALAKGEGITIAGDYSPDEWEIRRDEVVLETELGSGEFGLVYKGTWKNDPSKTPLQVAVKTLNDGASNQDRRSFLNEASVMKRFACDNVVRLLGIVSVGNPVMVVMELMANGDLKGYLRSLRPEDGDMFKFDNFPLSEKQLLQTAVGIATGMAYLATKKFVHRDLAARNCMVTGDFHVKIGDFGLTRDVYQTDYYRKTDRGPLPIRWMSPEALWDGLCTHASDVWSYGIVLWEIATLAMQPYPGMSNTDVFEFVTGGGVMNLTDIAHAQNSFIVMMERCWLYKPSDRPTFDTILEFMLSDDHENEE